MPASGKSTIGVLIAKRLGLDFVDTDIVIQTGEKKILAQILEDKGIKGFLKIEESYLVKSDYLKCVIAPGGSAVYSDKGMKHLKKSSIMVYLQLSLNFLEKRLLSLDARGVVRAPGQDIKSLFNERSLLYEKYADITLGCDSLSPDKIVSNFIKEIK